MITSSENYFCSREEKKTERKLFYREFHHIEQTLVLFSHFLVKQLIVLIDNQGQQLTKIFNTN
jgi:hypothetical protein